MNSLGTFIKRRFTTLFFICSKICSNLYELNLFIWYRLAQYCYNFALIFQTVHKKYVKEHFYSHSFLNIHTYTYIHINIHTYTWWVINISHTFVYVIRNSIFYAFCELCQNKSLYQYRVQISVYIIWNRIIPKHEGTWISSVRGRSPRAFVFRKWLFCIRFSFGANTCK